MKQSDSPNFLKYTTYASMISQVINKSIIHPIDTIKTKQQITIGKDIKYNLQNTIQQTYKNEGIKGFYKGVFISALGSAPAFGTYMTSYQYLKNNVLNIPMFDNYFGVKHFISGLGAELIACFIFLPIDIIKERLQVQSNLKLYNYKNGISAFQTILKNDGIKGIYRGYWATVAHFGPWSAFYFMFYEKYKKLFLNNADKPTFFQSFYTAAISGVTSSSLVNWIDVVKVRLQVQRTKASYDNISKNLENSEIIGGESQKYDQKMQYKIGQYGYKNLVHGAKILMKEEGFSAFFKGFGAKILLIAPSTAISMACTEFFRQKMLDMDKQH